MSLASAIGLAAGAALVVFGRDTPVGRRVLVELHLRSAQVRRWLKRR